MYSINLSILKYSNYIPEDHIVNLKQLSDTVVRVQLAERQETDKLPVVHSNSAKFATTHKDALTVDITMSASEEDVILYPKNFNPEDEELSKRKGFSISDLFADITKLILKVNEVCTTEGYTQENK